jgi:hypothetical protein
LHFEELTGNAAVPIEYSVDNGESWVTLPNLGEALLRHSVEEGFI